MTYRARFLCNKALVMEIIEKLLSVRKLIDHIPTVPPLNTNHFLQSKRLQYSGIILKRLCNHRLESLHSCLYLISHLQYNPLERYPSLTHYSRCLLHSAKANYWAVGLSRGELQPLATQTKRHLEDPSSSSLCPWVCVDECRFSWSAFSSSSTGE